MGISTGISLLQESMRWKSKSVYKLYRPLFLENSLFRPALCINEFSLALKYIAPWNGSEEENAVHQIKQCLCKQMVLSIYKTQLPWILETLVFPSVKVI